MPSQHELLLRRVFDYHLDETGNWTVEQRESIQWKPCESTGISSLPRLLPFLPTDTESIPSLPARAGSVREGLSSTSAARLNVVATLLEELQSLRSRQGCAFARFNKSTIRNAICISVLVIRALRISSIQRPPNARRSCDPPTGIYGQLREYRALIARA